jgi:hypothetical protein
MSKSINSPEFVAKKGDRLGPHEAEIVRDEVHRNDISIALLFELWSRMPAPGEYGTAPAATHYGDYAAPAMREVVTEPQPARESLGVTQQARENEVAELNATFYDDPSMGPEEYINAIAADEQPQTQDPAALDIEAIRAQVAREAGTNV